MDALHASVPFDRIARSSPSAAATKAVPSGPTAAGPYTSGLTAPVPGYAHAAVPSTDSLALPLLADPVRPKSLPAVLQG